MVSDWETMIRNDTIDIQGKTLLVYTAWEIIMCVYASIIFLSFRPSLRSASPLLLISSDLAVKMGIFVGDLQKIGIKVV